MHPPSVTLPLLGSKPRVALLAALLAGTLVTLTPPPAWAKRGGELVLKIVDADTRKPIAARIHLRHWGGRPTRQPRVAFWHDHFAIDGQITLELGPGTYLFDLERGPEYKIRSGRFEIKDDAQDEKTVEMHRFVNLAKEGWYSGDLNIQRPIKDMELLMQADDLHVAPVIAWRRTATGQQLQTIAAEPLTKFDKNRFFAANTCLDTGAGGPLLLMNLPKPPTFGEPFGPEYPSTAQFLVEAKRQSAYVDAPKPFALDLPIWLASGKLDSIGILNEHLQRTSVLDNEAGGKKRDRDAFPAPQGNGRWSESIYHQALNAGLRIAPSAGSGSGTGPNPVGYNRVYVHCGQDFSYQSWWENLRAGHVFVTNGPLLRTTVQGQPPGYIFQVDEGTAPEFEIGLTLSTREDIDYLEIIKNGRTEHHVRLSDFVDAKGKLPLLKFDRSGWFLIRAVTNQGKTYRLASTAPYYVEVGQQPYISRKAAQFFLDWVVERGKNLEIANPAHRAAVLKYHRAAHKFWKARVAAATAD